MATDDVPNTRGETERSSGSVAHVSWTTHGPTRPSLRRLSPHAGRVGRHPARRVASAVRGGCSSSFNRRVVRSSSWHPRPIGLSLPCGVVLSRYMALATAKGAADSGLSPARSPTPAFLTGSSGFMKFAHLQDDHPSGCLERNDSGSLSLLVDERPLLRVCIQDIQLGARNAFPMK